MTSAAFSKTAQAAPERKQVRFWNSRTQKMEDEAIFGEAPLRWLYESTLGRALTDHLLSRSFISRAYGALQETSFSAGKIEGFVRDFKIDLSEYEPGPWKSFNDFFIRKFREGARKFPEAAQSFGAPAEARYFAFEKLDPAQRFPVKGIALTASELLGSAEKAAPFVGGPAWIARLCPVDYHRYHYPDSGQTLDSYSLHGKLHSVSPIALHAKPDVLITNERRVAILETEHFGKIAYVEIGALNVGRIVQSHLEATAFTRGQEKGYFLFGGSSAVILGEPGRWKLDPAMAERSLQGIETWVALGTPLAERTP